ncbi:hypothetical protein ACFYZ8_33540 [Streptomyces sp. NPDC001668]|uniref:hypothetical protein n=1 Tax=Streptomyces sp. NPDC001668 TaxID=3364598 RepID=UPI003697CC20
MTVAFQIAACATCHAIADGWWTHGIADDRAGLRADELAFYEHLASAHPTVTLHGRSECRDCRSAVAMAQFAMADTAMYLKDGTPVDPARLHFIHHLLEQTADLDQAKVTSVHSFTAYLYHHASGAPAGHVCSPDRGHRYDVTVELVAPARLMSDEQTTTLKTVVAELDRDLQYREVERLDADRALATLDDLARWVHAAVTARLADGLGRRLRVRVQAPDVSAGPAVFPPPQ